MSGDVERDVVGGSDGSNEFMVDCRRALYEPRLLARRTVDTLDRSVAQRRQVQAIVRANDVIGNEVLPRVGCRGRSHRCRAQQLIDSGELGLCRRRCNHHIQHRCQPTIITDCR